MAVGNAITILPVSATCERQGCEQRSTVAMVVTGDVGTDGVAAYCDGHAADLEGEDNHTTVGEVKQ